MSSTGNGARWNLGEPGTSPFNGGTFGNFGDSLLAHPAAITGIHCYVAPVLSTCAAVVVEWTGTTAVPSHVKSNLVRGMAVKQLKDCWVTPRTTTQAYSCMPSRSNVVFNFILTGHLQKSKCPVRASRKLCRLLGVRVGGGEVPLQSPAKDNGSTRSVGDRQRQGSKWLHGFLVLK